MWISVPPLDRFDIERWPPSLGLDLQPRISDPHRLQSDQNADTDHSPISRAPRLLYLKEQKRPARPVPRTRTKTELVRVERHPLEEVIDDNDNINRNTTGSHPTRTRTARPASGFARTETGAPLALPFGRGDTDWMDGEIRARETGVRIKTETNVKGKGQIGVEPETKIPSTPNRTTMFRAKPSAPTSTLARPSTSTIVNKVKVSERSIQYNIHPVLLLQARISKSTVTDYYGVTSSPCFCSYIPFSMHDP